MRITDWTTIKPHLAPLLPLLEDEEITNIMANPGGKVFFEKAGRKELAPDITFPEQMKLIALQNIARLAGQNIDERRPYLTARLPDGARIAGASHRVIQGGNLLTIRRFPKQPYSLEKLQQFGVCPIDVAQILRAEVRRGSNILVAGGTNAGKTTLINALCGEIADSERIFTIEDISELRIFKPDVVNMQALEAAELTSVTIRDLLREVLRHNPTRIIIGELRHGEAYEFIQAMNTGHSGSMSTIHASGAFDALERLCDLVLLSGVDMPYRAIRRSVARTLNVVVFQHYDRIQGKREIQEVLRLDGYDPDTDQYKYSYLYKAEEYSLSDLALGSIEAVMEPVTTLSAHA